MEPDRTYTLADLAAAALAPGVPEELMAGRGRDVLPGVLGGLDGRITDFFGFEVHLGRPEAEVDALVCVKAETGGRESLAAAIVDAGPEAWWSDLRSFVAAWSDPLTPWASRVANIWLEFDVAAPLRPQPPPSLFFGAVRLIGPDEPTALPGLLEASGILRGGAVSASAWAIAGQVLDTLPARAAIFRIGQMMARPGAPLRLCVRDIGTNDLAVCLGELGFAARRREIGQLLGRLDSLGGEVCLDLDVGDDLGPRIGSSGCRPESPMHSCVRSRPCSTGWSTRGSAGRTRQRRCSAGPHWPTAGATARYGRPRCLPAMERPTVGRRAASSATCTTSRSCRRPTDRSRPRPIWPACTVSSPIVSSRRSCATSALAKRHSMIRPAHHASHDRLLAFFGSLQPSLPWDQLEDRGTGDVARDLALLTEMMRRSALGVVSSPI